MKLYNWIDVMDDDAGVIWYFIRHDGENFLGWKYDFREMEFFHNNIPLGNSKSWFYSRIPKYQRNMFVEKKGWKNFTKKEALKAKKKMFKNIFGDK